MLIANNPELEYDLEISKELDISHTERIDDEINNIMDNSKYWYINNLADIIINKFQNIDFESMSLMYFQPPKGYKISVAD